MIAANNSCLPHAARTSSARPCVAGSEPFDYCVALLEGSRGLPGGTPGGFLVWRMPRLNRPEANLTGVISFGGFQLNAKQLELLRDLVPKTSVFAVLVEVP
jgi:hypothetical protein